MAKTKRARFINPDMIRKILNKKFKPQYFAILVALSTYGRDGEDIYPSIGRIAHDINLSEKQTTRLMRGLREEGILVFRGKNGLGTNVYQLALNLFDDKGDFVGKRKRQLREVKDFEDIPF